MLIQADTEIEGANMALGAAATGARAATGSTGQGISLMQETIAEAALNELPVVFFNVARGQQDYFQATRGGGWGDYRTIALAPASVVEAAELTTLAFELADQWTDAGAVLRRPHDRLHADDHRAAARRRGEATARRSRGRSTAAAAAPAGRRSCGPGARASTTRPDPGPNRHWQSVAEKYDALAAVEARHVARHTDDAEVVVVSFGTTGAFVDYVVDELRADGHRIGTFRPVTLWPFPSAALAAVATSDACKLVLVHELNAGQMIDDVRLAVEGATPGARHRRREPGRVGHAPGRSPADRRDPRAHPRPHWRKLP